uniref:Uncharacterized protein n=1 Tax=Moniliophthora roreri TaxID=221103 RepID=A0A0W0FX45_MONRR
MAARAQSCNPNFEGKAVLISNGASGTVSTPGSGGSNAWYIQQNGQSPPRYILRNANDSNQALTRGENGYLKMAPASDSGNDLDQLFDIVCDTCTPGGPSFAEACMIKDPENRFVCVSASRSSPQELQRLGDHARLSDDGASFVVALGFDTLMAVLTGKATFDTKKAQLVDGSGCIRRIDVVGLASRPEHLDWYGKQRQQHLKLEGKINTIRLEGRREPTHLLYPSSVKETDLETLAAFPSNTFPLTISSVDRIELGGLREQQIDR